jgi:SAM-dependent methyltransferase
MKSDPERINTGVWQSGRVQDIFSRREGFVDDAEELMIGRLVGEAGGLPILDIGVGAGRTIPYLREASEEYVAVDYLPAMVDLARARHPQARVEQADARDLSMFADETFGGVFFSFNGIDGISHEARAEVHASVLRVLRPGGAFVFSTHNLDYACAGRPPWDRSRWDLYNGRRATVAFLARLPRRTRSYMRLRALTRRGDGWALLVGSGYDFSVLWHHVTAERAKRELAEAGYSPDIEVVDCSGAHVRPGESSGGSPWLYLLARKPR